MKRALFVLLIVIIALLVLVLWPPNLVRELESRAVAGDWFAAMTLADWYDADAHFAWAGVGGEDVPVSLRARRAFQRSEVTATFWSDAAFNLLVGAAAENDRRALFILGSGLDSQFDGRPYPNIERRDDYLVRMLLSDGPDPESDGFVFRRLGSRNPTLAESVRPSACSVRDGGVVGLASVRAWGSPEDGSDIGRA
jgi:hypothetical protein